MRRRVQRAVVAAVVVALAVFVLPLGLAATAFLAAQASQDLERVALEAAFRVGPSFRTGDPAELPVDGASPVGLYTPAGQRVSGSGPIRLERAARRARSGVIVQTGSGGTQVVAVPVTANESVIGIVRASRAGQAWGQPLALWLALVGIAAVIVIGSVLFARRAAAQLAAPVERLAEAAAGMGEGRLVVPSQSSGIIELDAAHAALVEAGTRIADLVEREQRIASDASHQLRTPLAGLRARIEVGLADRGADRGAVLADALVQLDRMDSTIDGLIALARRPDAASGQCDPTAVVEERAAHWRPMFVTDHRRLTLRVEAGVPTVAAARFAIVTVLDVLVENAYRHGRGDVELVLRTTGRVVAIDVIDSGQYDGPADPFVDRASGDGGSGLGLGLAQRTTADFGGRLLLAETAPRTRFGLLLPTISPDSGVRSAAEPNEPR
jgi:signal transduction histidine kinase